MLDYELRRRRLRASSSVTVFSPGAVFFDDVGPTVHAAVEPLLERQQIAVHTSKVVSRIAADHVEFADGSQLESALTVLLPVYAGNPLVIRSRLGDEQGFVPTDQTMRHLDHANIFAAGDGTANAMPKLGHIAVQQADIAAAMLCREILGSGDVPVFKPEVFCIMNRGGSAATLILSDALYGGTTDVAESSPLVHLMKWGFDNEYLHTRGHLPPDSLQDGLELLLSRRSGGFR
jgi:sulfide:quinone oxidoreductase